VYIYIQELPYTHQLHQQIAYDHQVRNSQPCQTLSDASRSISSPLTGVTKRHPDVQPRTLAVAKYCILIFWTPFARAV
jgi:hypothetical protein